MLKIPNEKYEEEKYVLNETTLMGLTTWNMQEKRQGVKTQQSELFVIELREEKKKDRTS